MDLYDLLLQRRSIRAYKPEPVDKELIEKVFSQAQRSPSNCNTQPWHVCVVSGETRNKLEQALLAEVTSGKPPYSFFKPGDQGLKDDYRKRQIACAVDLYEAVDIKYEDKEKRQIQMLQNWQFFGAPHAAIISMPKTFGETNAIDVGIYVQTLMLLMSSHGIGCCPQGALAHFPDPILDMLDIPEENAVLMGLSFGYAEEDAPINQYDVGREDMHNVVKFYS